MLPPNAPPMANAHGVWAGRANPVPAAGPASSRRHARRPQGPGGTFRTVPLGTWAAVSSPAADGPCTTKRRMVTPSTPGHHTAGHEPHLSCADPLLSHITPEASQRTPLLCDPRDSVAPDLKAGPSAVPPCSPTFTHGSAQVDLLTRQSRPCRKRGLHGGSVPTDGQPARFA
jgi:hypothetical protein